ncbi:MAG TPA: aldehyde dehydrogenase (NADP(+)), partial [Terriglobales bacterium]|nr:aldehyde dehydrogenase (NADP(+)) [Terriglobales bacterium]
MMADGDDRMATIKSTLSGVSLIGGRSAGQGGESFQATNPTNGVNLQPTFYAATQPEIEQAARLAAEAFSVFSSLSGRARADLLCRIADDLAAATAEIIARANLETGLPMARLQAEMGRTTGQMKLFADVLQEGSWVNARIDEEDPQRKPPRPDLRSMLRPLGPVAVFGASNFPLAFSVAGGDTASALAAGNPVVVKAHPAHPGTSELVGVVIQKAVEQSGLPPGVFSLLFDSGIEVGVALAKHAAIKAIAFTGSAAGGQALMKLAAARPEPIPCYAEMGSTNPVFVLPGAMRERTAQIAKTLQTSFTLGSGQFCTKPGLLFVPKDGTTEFVDLLTTGIRGLQAQQMLTPGIAARYKESVQRRIANGHAKLIACTEVDVGDVCAATAATIFSVSLENFFDHPELAEEVFGPTTLLVHYGSKNDLVDAAERLSGHLTATIHGSEQDLVDAPDLIRVLESKAGRLLFNGAPTGVEVCHAIVHSGPYPATSDSRSTSVGTLAMLRFARPVCYQDFPDTALPVELQRDNPLGILRLVNGTYTRD